MSGARGGIVRNEENGEEDISKGATWTAVAAPSDLVPQQLALLIGENDGHSESSYLHISYVTDFSYFPVVMFTQKCGWAENMSY
jgi:hypothetical protein